MMIPTDRHQEIGQVLQRIGRGDVVETYETVRQRKDGVEIYISSTVSGLKRMEITLDAGLDLLHAPFELSSREVAITRVDFRRQNANAIRAVCAQFIVICGQLGLFSHAVAAIDGAKFKAVNEVLFAETAGCLRIRCEPAWEHRA